MPAALRLHSQVCVHVADGVSAPGERSVSANGTMSIHPTEKGARGGTSRHLIRARCRAARSLPLRQPQPPRGDGVATTSSRPARRRCRGRRQRAQLLRRPEDEGQIAGGVARGKRGCEGSKLKECRSGRMPPSHDGLDRQVQQGRREVARPTSQRRSASARTGNGQQGGNAGPGRRSLDDVAGAAEAR